MKSGDNRIAIELPKGLKLVAEQNVNPEYQNEIYVGIETSDGIWHQDLAVIRNASSLMIISLSIGTRISLRFSSMQTRTVRIIPTNSRLNFVTMGSSFLCLCQIDIKTKNGGRMVIV